MTIRESCPRVARRKIVMGIATPRDASRQLAGRGARPFAISPQPDGDPANASPRHPAPPITIPGHGERPTSNEVSRYLVRPPADPGHTRRDGRGTWSRYLACPNPVAQRPHREACTGFSRSLPPGSRRAASPLALARSATRTAAAPSRCEPAPPWGRFARSANASSARGSSRGEAQRSEAPPSNGTSCAGRI